MKRPGKQRVLRRLGAATIGLVALAAVATASASSPPILSNASLFGGSSEGWQAVSGQSISPMTWQSSGGNPGGYITTDFASGGGLIQSEAHTAGSTWPAGNAVGDYGGQLAADVRVSLVASSGTEDLVLGFLSNNVGQAVCDDLGAPTSSWATYTVPLDTSHLVGCLSGKPLTGAQVSAELAGFQSMFIAAENHDGVEEVVDVDNAVLSPSESPTTPPTGKIGRTLTLVYKAHKLTGVLVAPDDYSCGANMKVTIFGKGKKPTKVGTVKTYTVPHASGLWLFSLKLEKGSRGTFYATVSKATSKLDGNSCAAAQSKSVTVH